MKGNEGISRSGPGVRLRRPSSDDSEAPSTGAAPPTPEALFPKLVPRRNASPKAVSDHQRARLHAAMIEACARYGYTEATVREIAALAGVSKKTLYKHFPSKEACFLSTYDLVIRDAVARISAAYKGEPSHERDWAAGLCRAFEAFVAELVERPKPSRLALVDVLLIGPPAQEPIERAQKHFVWMIARSLAQAPDPVSLPPFLIRSLTDGIWFVASTRLLEGKPATISESGRELLDWILAYHAPAVESLPRGAPPRRRHSASRRDSAGHDERTRMLYAAADIAARRGYRSLSVGEIAERAGVRPDAVTAEFDDPSECFLASLELLCVQALADALRESRDAEDWPTGVCRATRALLCQIAEDRVFARTAFVESVAAGPAGAGRRTALIRGFAGALLRRAPTEGRPSPLVAEAIVGSVWSIANRAAAEERTGQLPLLAGHVSFLLLAPVIGATAAHEAILAEFGNGQSMGSREGLLRLHPDATQLKSIAGGI